MLYLKVDFEIIQLVFSFFLQESLQYVGLTFKLAFLELRFNLKSSYLSISNLFLSLSPHFDLQLCLHMTVLKHDFTMSSQGGGLKFPI